MKALCSILRIAGALLALNGFVSDNAQLGILVGVALIVVSYFIPQDKAKS